MQCAEFLTDGNNIIKLLDAEINLRVINTLCALKICLPTVFVGFIVTKEHNWN